MFNGKRLSLARKRRRHTAKALADLAGVNQATIIRLEGGQHEADVSTVEKLAAALNYPTAFFYRPEGTELAATNVSFRSLKAMSAKQRESAIAAGELGIDLMHWVNDRFTLPSPDIPEMPSEMESNPESAARLVRQHWGLGDRPIPALLKLFEAKGIRILGLEEETKNVDAFSFWDGEQPFVFLNSFKSAERGLFDAAHELGHLVMHRHGAKGDSRLAENEANAFASAFLMPKSDILAQAPRIIGASTILKLKARWRVSAMALAYRMRALGLLTEWQHRSICIELGKRGYRSGEPVGIERENSAIWPMILRMMWEKRQTRENFAADLGIPMDEVQALLSGILPDSNLNASQSGGPHKLRLA